MTSSPPALRRAIGTAAAATTALAAAIVFAPAAVASPGQTVTPLAAGSPDELVQMLIGDDTPFSNATVTGSTDAIGSFSGMSAAGIDAGVALSTGSLAEAKNILVGPNEHADYGTSLGQPGDADLEALSSGTTYDAVALEFDFVPSTDTVSFEYVFGSDEYLEYVGDGVNDTFAFFVNGTNVATLDDGTIVSIDTINHAMNADIFVDNEDGAHDTEMDGFTTALGIEAPVNVGETNHIKIVIADRGDGILDSAVLLAAGSFRSNTPPVADDLTVTTPLETPVDIILTGSDAENDPLTFEVVDGPSNGTLDGTGANLTYTPAEGFEGTDTFTYVANDGSLTSEPATVTITVAPPVVTPTPTETPTVTPTETTTPTETVTSTPTASVPPVTPGDDGLANTGADDAFGFVAAATALVLVGGGVLLLTLRRRTT